MKNRIARAWALASLCLLVAGACARSTSTGSPPLSLTPPPAASPTMAVTLLPSPSPSHAPPASPGASPTPVATLTAAPGGSTFRDADNGRTVALHIGEQFQIVLASTYWTFQGSPSPAVVRMDGTPTVQPSPFGCVPGQGCGTATAAFTATGPGTVTLTASRTSCGEAMACTGSAGRYSLTVAVAG